MHVPSGVATLFVFIAVGVATLFKHYFIGPVLGLNKRNFRGKRAGLSAVQCLEVVFNLPNTKGWLLHQNYSFL
jgi:hypothetical protein